MLLLIQLILKAGHDERWKGKTILKGKGRDKTNEKLTRSKTDRYIHLVSFKRCIKGKKLLTRKLVAYTRILKNRKFSLRQSKLENS